MRRWVAAVGIALAAGLAAAAAAPGWVRGVGLDVWNWDAEVARLRAEEALAGELRAELAERAARAAAMDAVTARLVDGRLSLAEATDELERVTAGRPDFVLGLRCSYPAAATDREAHALCAVERARCAVEHDPTRLAEVTARLGAGHRASPGADPPLPR